MPRMGSLDFFDIKSSKKITNSKNRYNIKTYLVTSYALDIKDSKSTFAHDIAKLTNDNKNLDLGKVRGGQLPRAPVRVPWRRFQDLVSQLILAIVALRQRDLGKV